MKKYCPNSHAQKELKIHQGGGCFDVVFDKDMAILSIKGLKRYEVKKSFFEDNFYPVVIGKP